MKRIKFNKKRIIIIIVIILIIAALIMFLKTLNKMKIENNTKEDDNIIYTHELNYNIYI